LIVLRGGVPDSDLSVLRGNIPDTDSDFFVLRDNVHHSVLIVLGGNVPTTVRKLPHRTIKTLPGNYLLEQSRHCQEITS
jgi:hypothetical protein